MKTEVTLAPGYDEAVFARLRQAAESLAGYIHDESWAMAGGVEISTWKITFPDGELIAVAETHVGLSVEGPKGLVQRVATAFSSNTKNSGLSG